MGLFHRIDTHKLTSAPFQVSSGHGLRRVLCALLVVALLGGLAAGGLEYFERQLAPARRVLELEQENATLRRGGEEARMALEMERATRGELERQVSELNQQVQRLNEELGFLRSQSRSR